MSDDQTPERQHALTPAQRFHLEVNGYVVVEDVLGADEISRMLEAMQRLKCEFLASDDLTHTTIRRSSVKSDSQPNHLHFTRILETDPAILEYLAHPRVVALAEELTGGAVCLEESEAVINSRTPGSEIPDPPRFGFHKGASHGFATHTENGLFHCVFVKVLTNLTDLGPDDGGTTVIAGSHKLSLPADQIIAAAYQDPSLIHTITAPAGSAVLFPETLIHATGINSSMNERCILIGGYTPTMFKVWPGQEPSAGFIESLPDDLHQLITGSQSWNGARNARPSLA